jgi:hypothetical protein
MVSRVERLAENIETVVDLQDGHEETCVRPLTRGLLAFLLDVHRSGGTHVSIEGVLEVMRRETGADHVT